MALTPGFVSHYAGEGMAGDGSLLDAGPPEGGSQTHPYKGCTVG